MPSWGNIWFEMGNQCIGSKLYDENNAEMHFWSMLIATVFIIEIPKKASMILKENKRVKTLMMCSCPSPPNSCTDESAKLSITKRCMYI